MTTNIKFEKKDGENWYITKVNMKDLTDDQALKVQEMLDNKTHQRLQTGMMEKQNLYNLILALVGIVLATGAFLQIILYIAQNGISLKEGAAWYLNLGFIIGVFILIAFMAGLIIILIKIPLKKR